MATTSAGDGHAGAARGCGSESAVHGGAFEGASDNAVRQHHSATCADLT